jgi:hypothetical protein
MGTGAWWHRGKEALAATLAGVGLAVVLIAAWSLPAPARAPDRTIALEPEVHTIYTSSTDPMRSTWIGPMAWDVRFPGSGSVLATAGPWNPLTFRGLRGARADWSSHWAAEAHGVAHGRGSSGPYGEFGRSDRRAPGDRSTMRSIRPERASNRDLPPSEASPAVLSHCSSRMR